jgi:hypothetical protein
MRTPPGRASERGCSPARRSTYPDHAIRVKEKKPVADDMTEAEQFMADKERWGLSQADMAVVRLVRLVKLARADLVDAKAAIVDLRARVRALETK